MTPLQERLTAIRAQLPEGVRLVAVSKYHPVEALQEAYDAGQRVFGESHEQELRTKHQQLPADIEWHFIGHLQTNKVRFIAPYIDMVEAVDSLHLLQEIDRQAQRCHRRIKVLLELHIAREATKYGLTPDALRQLLDAGQWRDMQGVEICGLMMMATNTDDQTQIESEFRAGAALFDEVKARYFADQPSFCERSWGMSHDYATAIKCRSTMVRIGTAIFGEREYPR
jgi:hypothetical protein